MRSGLYSAKAIQQTPMAFLTSLAPAYLLCSTVCASRSRPPRSFPLWQYSQFISLGLLSAVLCASKHMFCARGVRLVLPCRRSGAAPLPSFQLQWWQNVNVPLAPYATK
eukprot:scaffold28228_cov37-Tisochrysis_lutea.AAC.1